MPARVLLVEDDAAIRRFFTLALEELPMQVVEAASLRAGREALARQSFELVVTDLMLPDGHGVELLEQLAAQPRAPERIVFSAGVHAAMRARLEALGVRRILIKPAPIAAVLEAVQGALSGREPAGSPLARPTADDPVQSHFGGDATLYAAFRDATLEQFVADIVEGDRCAQQSDLPAMRRLAHSLKSVLGLLGDSASAQAARALERRAAAGEMAAIADWPALRAPLAQWVARR